MIGWEKYAVAWLRGKAAEQAKINDQYPDHAKSYPSWIERVKFAQQLADNLELEAARESSVTPVI